MATENQNGWAKPTLRRCLFSNHPTRPNRIKLDDPPTVGMCNNNESASSNIVGSIFVIIVIITIMMMLAYGSDVWFFFIILYVYPHQSFMNQIVLSH
jgi:hypothetical protein